MHVSIKSVCASSGSVFHTSKIRQEVQILLTGKQFPEHSQKLHRKTRSSPYIKTLCGIMMYCNFLILQPQNKYVFPFNLMPINNGGTTHVGNQNLQIKRNHSKPTFTDLKRVIFTQCN